MCARCGTQMMQNECVYSGIVLQIRDFHVVRHVMSILCVSAGFVSCRLYVLLSLSHIDRRCYWIMSLWLGRVLNDCQLKAHRFINSAAEVPGALWSPTTNTPRTHGNLSGFNMSRPVIRSPNTNTKYKTLIALGENLHQKQNDFHSIITGSLIGCFTSSNWL